MTQTAVFRDEALEKELQLSRLHPKTAPSVFDDLTAYFKQPIDSVAAEYWRYRRNEDVQAQQKVATATTEDPIHAYYAQTPHYLYELSYWEASPEKQAWFSVLYRAFRRLGLKRIVDFGGGVGGLSVYMASRGLECTHVDVPGKTRDYAAWRFARRNLKVAVLDATRPEGWPKAQRDAVVAYDVLEHLFDLEGAVANIAGLLRPGGYFLNLSTFANTCEGHEHIHLAKHACYHDIKRFNAMICERGFRFVGQLKPSGLSRLLRKCGVKNAVVGARIVPKLKHGGNFLVHQRAS